jgi:hypothetical protein
MRSYLFSFFVPKALEGNKKNAERCERSDIKKGRQTCSRRIFEYMNRKGDREDDL